MTYLLPLLCGAFAAAIAVVFYAWGRAAGRRGAQARVDRAYELGVVAGSFTATEAAIKARLAAMEATR